MTGCAGRRGACYCLGEPIGMLTVGCVHEHLSIDRVCENCLATARRAMAENRFICITCEESGRPHRCQRKELRWEPGLRRSA